MPTVHHYNYLKLDVIDGSSRQRNWNNNFRKFFITLIIFNSEICALIKKFCM